jgi:hypothetical protein
MVATSMLMRWTGVAWEVCFSVRSLWQGTGVWVDRVEL